MAVFFAVAAAVAGLTFVVVAGVVVAGIVGAELNAVFIGEVGATVDLVVVIPPAVARG